MKNIVKIADLQTRDATPCESVDQVVLQHWLFVTFYHALQSVHSGEMAHLQADKVLVLYSDCITFVYILINEDFQLTK